MFKFRTVAAISLMAGGWLPESVKAAEWSVDADYMLETVHNLEGGDRRAGAVQGLFDLAAMGNWGSSDQPLGSLQARLLFLHGASASGLVGDSLGVSNIEGYDGVRLAELWGEIHWPRIGGSLRIGSQLADAEFAVTESGGVFMNSAFGWPAFMSGNLVNGGPAYPQGAVGLRFAFAPSPANQLLLAVFDGDPWDSFEGDPHVNRHGVRWRYHDHQGILVLVEGSRRWAQGRGTWKLGGWLHTDTVRYAGGQMSAGRNTGLYGLMEWRLAETGGPLFFLRAGSDFSQRGEVGHAIDMGLSGPATWLGRSKDFWGIGWVHAAASRGLKSQQVVDGATVISDHERVLELAYAAELNARLGVLVSIQRIGHPGGSDALPDAWVVGVRMSWIL